MLKSVFVAAIAFVSLSACNSGSNAYANSGFASPSPSGQIGGELSDSFSSNLIDSSGDGFAYAADGFDDRGFVARAGLVEGTDVSAPPLSGGASFTGPYRITGYEDISFGTNSVSAFRSGDAGNITLTANFDNATLTGSDGALSVDGDLDGETLSGNVTYNGLRGDLRGLVGGDKTVGAFHGNSAETIYSGGFIAYRNPN